MQMYEQKYYDLNFILSQYTERQYEEKWDYTHCNMHSVSSTAKELCYSLRMSSWHEAVQGKTQLLPQTSSLSWG